MNLQEHIRKVLIEEFPQEDYSNQIIKNISAVDSILKALYPNFNKDGAHLKERRPLFWDSFLYECFDNKTDHIYASYTPTKRELHMNPEIYKTLENYLGEDAATYVIDWFNSEFDTEAEHVTY
jgi:hypothetical protein